MKLILGLLSITYLYNILLFSTGQVRADSICSPSYPSSIQPGSEASISFDLPTNEQNSGYEIRGCNTGWYGTYGCLNYSTFPVDNQEKKEAKITAKPIRNSGLTFWLELDGTRVCGGREWRVETSSSSNPAVCNPGTFKVEGVRGGELIENYTFQDDIRITVDGAHTANFASGTYTLYLEGPGASDTSPLGNIDASDGKLLTNNLSTRTESSIYTRKLAVGTYRLVVADGNAIGSYRYCENTVFTVSSDGNNLFTETGNTSGFLLCKQAGPLESECLKCVDGVWTAIGCIPTNVNSTVRALFNIGLGLAGGFALVFILFGAFTVSTSVGNPEKVKSGQEMITAAIFGLLFIIFSSLILRFIGVSILQIPGF